MEFSEFTLRIILIFIPGILAFYIYATLSEHKQFKIYEVAVGSLLLGILSYVVYYLFIKNILKEKIDLTFFKALIDKKIDLDFMKIFIVTLTSIPIGIIITYIRTYKLIFRIAHIFRMTKKFGDIDLLNYLLNSPRLEKEWIQVVDKNNNLIYFGWIEAWTRLSEENELFMINVSVYDYIERKLLYEVPAIYLPMNWKDLTFEYPLLQSEEKQERRCMKWVKKIIMKLRQKLARIME